MTELDSVVLSSTDASFEARGVVADIETSAGRLFLKDCPVDSSEPKICSLAAEVLPEFSEIPLLVNAEQGYIITAYHGESIYPDTAEMEIEAVCLLARMQIAPTKSVSRLLREGVVDGSPDVILDRFSELCQHPFMDWICNQRDTVHPSVINAIYLVRANESKFERLFNKTPDFGGYPSVLLHNDAFSGNCFRERGSLKLFDWGLSTVGHPFADMSFWDIETDCTAEFIRIWAEEGGYQFEHANELFTALVPHRSVVHLLLLLNVANNVEASEKLHSNVQNIFLFVA